MYNRNKLSFTQTLSKKSIVYGTIISIVLIGFSIIPIAHGLTNIFVGIAHGSCNSCANPFTITDTATNSNDLLVFVMSCQTSFAITGITDTITNVWSNTGTSQSYVIQNGQVDSTHTGTTTFYVFVWFAQAKSTSASTASITTSSASSNCNYQVYDGNTIFTAYQSDFISSVNYNVQTSASPTLATTQSFSANTISLTLGEFIFQPGSAGTCGGSTGTQPPNQFINCNVATGMPLSDGTCTGVDKCTLGIISGTFQTLSSVTSGIGFTFGTSSNCCQTSSYSAALVILGYNFNISGTITSVGTTQTQNLCSSTFTPTSGSTKTGNIVSNYSYWSPIYNAIGIGSGNSIFVTNITLWVASINLTNSQTAVDIYLLMYFPTGAFSPNNQPQLPTATAPWNPGFNYPSQTGVAQQAGKVLLISTQHFTNRNTPFKISTPLAITSVAAGISFAIGFYITHNGVNLVKCTGSFPQLYQQITPSSNIVNSGFDVAMTPDSFGIGRLNSANQNGTTPYFYTLINQPGTTTIQTVTSTVLIVTSFSTVTSTTTTGVATTTLFSTTTVITNAFASPTGGAQIETNLITYWPIWALPLIFGALGGSMGFGLGGMLYGLMFSLILLQLDGQIPLWTVFIDIIMIYVILRR